MRRFIACALVVLLAGCNLAAADPTAVPTPDAPRVEFLFPENGATVLAGTDMTIDIVARDDGAGVARIELFVDDVSYRQALPETSLAVPVFRVEMNWLAEGTGAHLLTAVAYRSDDTASPPADIFVEVLPR